MPSPVGDGRYVPRELLGTGARKEVWLATDSRLDRDIALALVPGADLDDAGRNRLEREAKVMARLGDHPNVVSVLDVGVEGSSHFIVSQYMGGGTLSDRIAEAPDGRLAVADALAVATDLTSALEHAHELGVIHRDLKPANVFFGADGRAQLGDFGLAASDEEARLTAEGMVVGTVAYMPPEQTLGKDLDPRSDLYSLGALMYETLTGRPPFVGENAVSVISQHLRADPVALRWHNDAVSVELEELVLNLLAKAADDRPQSAAAVLERLSACSPVDASAVESAPEAPARPPAQWGSYVGRVEERDRLSSALQTALAGRARMVMIVGEPGIGKTRTVEELAAEAGVHGAQVLWGHAYEGDINAPHMPFADALRGFTRALEPDALSDVLASDVAEIASLIPEIRDRVDRVPDLPRLEGEADRYRLYEAVTSFVRRAARDTPLMLVLEDLHWADKPSLMLLQYLARSLDADRVFIVCTYRDVELERTHPLAATLNALRREHLYERVLLQGMTVEEVQALIGAVGGQTAPVEFATRLQAETRGNPFFVAEILQHLVESGGLTFEGGQWVGSLESIEMALPEGVRDVIGRRLDHLSEDCNKMLTVAAAMTSGFLLDTVAAVAGFDEDTALDLLDEALAARIVQERREPRGSFDFTHALIRQTLYAELSTPRRSRLHRQILEVIEPNGADVAELAHHAFQSISAGDVDLAIGYAMQAGQRAMESVAFEDATRHFDMALQALELAGDEDPSRRAEILLEIAEAQMYAAAAPAALEASDEAAEIGVSLGRFDLVARAAVHRARHNYLALTVTDQKLVEIADTAIDGLADDDEHRALRARVLGSLALHISSTEPARSRVLAEQSVAEWRLAPDPEALHDAMRAILFLAGSVSDPDGLLQAPAFEGVLPDGETLTLNRAEELLAELRPGHDLTALSEAAMRRFYIAIRDGDGDGYKAASADMLQLATESRSPVVQTNAGYYAGVAEIIQGNYEAGSAAMRTFSKNCRDYGFNSDMLNNVGISLVPMLREQGGLESLLEPTREVVARMDHEAWKGSLALILAEVGRLDEAAAMIEEVVIGTPERLGGDVVIAFARAMYADVAATIEHRVAAKVLLELMADDPAASVGVGPYSYYGAMDRYRGRLLTVLDRHDEAVAMQRRAIEFAERMYSPSWVARGQFDLAAALLTRGDSADRAEAVSLLNEALVAATEIGMTRLIEEVTLQKLVLQGIDPNVEVSSSIAMVAESVNIDALAQAGAADPTLTLLFSDIVGYTQMTERLGDEAAHRILRQHNDVLRRALANHHGREVKSEGDGFMLAFDTVPDACRFALEVNRNLAALELDSGAGRVRVRMGIHTGEVIRDDDDFFGRTVIVAARIAALAGGDEVLLSSVATAAAADGGLALGDTRMVSLKGLSGEHEVCQLQLRRE